MFYCFYRRNESKYLHKVLFLLFGLGATISFSTGLFTFPALVAAYFLAYRPSWKKVIIYIVPVVTLVLASLVFSYNLSKFSGLVDIKVIIPVIVSSVFMYGMATGYLGLAAMLGALIMVFTIKQALTLKNIKDNKEKELNIIWLGISIYCMLCIFAIGIGRFEVHGINYIGYSRYQLLPAILFLSTFVLFLRNKTDIQGKLVLAIALTIICMTYKKGEHYINYHRLGQDRNELNVYSLPLDKFYVYSIFNDPELDANSKRMRDLINGSTKVLKQYSNIPFNENKWDSCQKIIHSGLPSNIKESAENKLGVISELSTEPHINWHANYHEILVYSPIDEKWECVLLLDSDNKIIGGGHMAKYSPFFHRRANHQLYRTYIPVFKDNNYDGVSVLTINKNSGDATKYPLKIEENDFE